MDCEHPWFESHVKQVSDIPALEGMPQPPAGVVYLEVQARCTTCKEKVLFDLPPILHVGMHLSGTLQGGTVARLRGTVAAASAGEADAWQPVVMPQAPAPLPGEEVAST